MVSQNYRTVSIGHSRREHLYMSGRTTLTADIHIEVYSKGVMPIGQSNEITAEVIRDGLSAYSWLRKRCGE